MATQRLFNLLAQDAIYQMRGLLFSALRYQDAARLMQALGVQLPARAYTQCQLRCESEFLGGTAAGPAPAWDCFVIGPPAPGHNRSHASPQAAWINRSSADARNPGGYLEPSLCVEPEPQPNAHGNRPLHDRSAPRLVVCIPCKQARAEEWRWWKAIRQIGVCKSCRLWAIANMQPQQDDCQCLPVGNYTHGVNNNEPKYMHLCDKHDNYYHALNGDDAWRELRRRQNMLRTRNKKKRGHGWTRTARPPTRTPQERRLATKLRIPALGNNPTSVPTCFCGQAMTDADHAVTGPSAPLVPTNQVRCCLGCHGFLRRCMEHMAHSDAWNLRTKFESLPMQNALFPHLAFNEARNLMSAFRIPLRRENYVHADVRCDSGWRHGPTEWPVLPSWWNPLPPHVVPTMGGFVLDQEAVCRNEAKEFNAATASPGHPEGRREPSLCVEPGHLRQHGDQAIDPDAPRVVCRSCKEERASMYLWRKQQLYTGVCRECRKWAVRNMDEFQDDCVCGIHERSYTDGINNNERKFMHLCYEHDLRYWTMMRRNAVKELDRRLRMKRVVARKKRGNGWTQKKQHGARIARTPHERRWVNELTDQDLATLPLQAELRCYCGERVGTVAGVSGHDRTDMAADRVKNCLGCNRFRRQEY